MRFFNIFFSSVTRRDEVADVQHAESSSPLKSSQHAGLMSHWWCEDRKMMPSWARPKQVDVSWTPFNKMKSFDEPLRCAKNSALCEKQCSHTESDFALNWQAHVQAVFWSAWLASRLGVIELIIILLEQRSSRKISSFRIRLSLIVEVGAQFQNGVAECALHVTMVFCAL